MAFIPQIAGVLLKGVRGLVPWKLRCKSKYMGSYVRMCFTSFLLSIHSIKYDKIGNVKCVCFELNCGGRRDGLCLRRFCSTFVYYDVKLSLRLSRLRIKTADVRLVFWMKLTAGFSVQFLWHCDTRACLIIGTLCVSRGHPVLLLCGSIYCLKWYPWSPIAKPGQPGDLTKRHVCCCICLLHGVLFCLVLQACVHVCVCVKTELSLQTCVYVCLTFVLWLVIAGNPSTSQSKKTIKQRFLKLLPCCKPSAAPSISQSKCSFTLYTSLLPSVCPAFLVNWEDPYRPLCGCSHVHTAYETISVHINPHTETCSTLKHSGIIASNGSDLFSCYVVRVMDACACVNVCVCALTEVPGWFKGCQN